MNARPVAAPSRPTLPPLFIAAACIWVSIACAEDLTWRIFIEELDILQTVLIICLVALSLLAVILSAHRLGSRGATRWIPTRFRPALVIASISIGTGIVCGFMYWTSWEQSVELLPVLFDNEEIIRVDLTGDPSERDYGSVSTALLELGGRTVKVRLIWPEESEPIFAGHAIEVTGNALSPQASESGRWSHQNGYVGTIKVESVREAGTSASLQGLVAGFRDKTFSCLKDQPGEAAGLLSGILLGNKTIYEGTELELAFRTTGLAHLMAVSGTHLAIVSMLVSLILSNLPVRRIIRTTLLIAAIGFYVALTGFAPSALRAFVMCGVALIVGIMQRRPDIIGSLSLCVFAFIGLDPTIIFFTGFQLSVLAVFGLVLFGNLATCWLQELAPFLPETVRSSIGATLAASVATLPVTVPLFAQLPMISPLANLIVAPLITIALSIGMLGIVANGFMAPIGFALLAIASAIANLSASLVRALADIPGACLPISSGSLIIFILFIAFFAILWAAWPLPKDGIAEHDAQRARRHAKRLGGALCCFALPLLIAAFIGFGQFQIARPMSDSRLVILDVGQGDSILIQSGDASVLIDTGERSDVLIRELAEKSVSHLDAIFISHKDADHAGALKKLSGIVNVDHVYVHQDLLGKEVMQDVLDSADWVTAGKGAEGVSPGFKARLGEFTLTVVAPQQGGESKNEDSLVILVEFDAENDGTIEARGILTGDAEQDAMKQVVPQVGDIDFLKVAHHGSKGGLNEDQLRQLSPELALISVGSDNKYGHPTQDTLHMLSQAHARVYRTDEQGAISVFFTKEGMAIETER